MRRICFFRLLLLPCLLMAGMESATAQTTFTKWKQVQDPSTLQTNDVVVIVDMTTANAMRNNPEYEGENTVSKASPPALKVTLKEELDRITSEVGDTIVWTADRTDGKYAFKTASKGHYLFNSDQNLRVGYVSSNDAWKRKFEMDKSLLFMEHVETGPDEFKDYHVGLKVASGIQSMMGGSTWELMADSVNTETGDTYVNKEITATKMAFFKKVETTLPDPTLYFPGHDYEADVQNPNDFESPVATVDEAGAGSITYYSGNTELAEVNSTTGVVTPKKRGTVRIYAQVAATEAYDDYLTSYILRIDDSEAAGGRNHPFSVAEAIAYAKAEGHEEETANGVGYFVKGIVSSVGGVMAGMEGMEDMMSMMSGMMEGLDMGDFDMSSVLSMFMGEQEPGTVTYAISDNGVNRDSLSVINGRGVLLDNVLVDITADSLSVGDWVTVYGPLDYSENNDMMSMFGGGNKEKTAKMPRVNYMSEHKRNLITEDITLYFGQTKQTDDLFSITDLFGGELVTNTNAADNTLPKTSIKLSDTGVASWVVDGADSLLTPKKSGIITVTVNAPVLLQAGDTIKMKRKFNLDVRDRKVLPSGTMVGNYELVTDASQLKPDDKLLIVATIGDKSKVLNRKAGSNSDSSNPMASMFGGGGNASDITIDNDGKITEMPDDALILTLEQSDDNQLLQTGRTADYIMTYLYVSDNDNGSSSMIPGMGSSGASLKTGTREAVSDSCLVSFTFLAEKNDSVKIQFNFSDREKDGKTVTAKNVIRYEKGTMSTSFGGFEPESDKATLPRLYRLVQVDEYSITIGETMWATIVSAYDVTLPSDEDDNIKAYIVKDVQAEETQSKAKLEAVSELKGGEPYLLHGNPGQYTLTRTTNVAKPDGNKLLISDDTTSGVKGNTTIYVLADRSKGIGFYRWTGGLLGAGRVYLSVEDRVANAHEYCGFFVDETTGIQSIDDSKASADPFHDLQGRRVDHPTKGIYIANGKKLIVK